MRLRNIWVGTLAWRSRPRSRVRRRSKETSSTSGEPRRRRRRRPARRSTRRPPATSKAWSRSTARRPKNEPIKMNADPVCVKQNTTPAVPGDLRRRRDGKSLGNVFVYVKDGLGNYVYDTPTEPAKIDQKNCRYHPHVFGMRVGQPLEIVNSDPTLHNIHALPKAQQGVQQRPADPGHEDDAHLRQRRK